MRAIQACINHLRKIKLLMEILKSLKFFFLLLSTPPRSLYLLWDSNFSEPASLVLNIHQEDTIKEIMGIVRGVCVAYFLLGSR